MDLDLHTLLYVCIAAATLAAAMLAVFGTTQGTHRGFRAWSVAQWLLVAALVLQALIGDYGWSLPLVGALVLQWPVAVLLGMRRLQMRKPPSIPPAADVALLVFAVVLLAGAWFSDAGAARPISAFTLGGFVVDLYAAAIVTRLGGFQHSFALKSLAAILATTSVLHAVCCGIATLAPASSGALAAVPLAAMVATVVAALGLVPIALALTYERTVAKMQARHRKLRHLADIDVLTRLPNRQHFHELATRALATSEAAQCAVLTLDIENLKRINDLLGNATGDEALRQVGLALRETLRSRDVAGRLGGDEFGALLPDTTVQDAVRVAERITRRLDDRQVAPRSARLTLNVGAVQMRVGDTIVEALRRADIALDDARGRRRGERVTSAPVPAPEMEATEVLQMEVPPVLEPKAT
jgi:diguanylate cyclase (GGDEF)-like protein